MSPKTSMLPPTRTSNTSLDATKASTGNTWYRDRPGHDGEATGVADAAGGCTRQSNPPASSDSVTITVTVLPPDPSVAVQVKVAPASAAHAGRADDGELATDLRDQA